MRASKTLVFVAGLLAAVAGTSGSSQCSRYCKEEKNVFGYEPGKSYVYNYNGAVRNLINSTRDGVVPDESGVQIKFSAEIHVISTCDFVLKISRVAMEEQKVRNGLRTTATPPGDDFVKFRERLELNPLHFSFHGGKIDTICAQEDEPKEILDVKKGVLSSFQNSMQDLQKDTLVHETDITGTCETLYKVKKSSQFTTVEKTKNLDACTHRMSQYLSWQSVPYATNFNAKSLPLLRSKLICIQKYNRENILSSSTCHEQHIFQPFSNGDSGAMTAVRQELVLRSIHDKNLVDVKLPKNIRRASLAYESTFKNLPDVNMDKVLDILVALETKTADGVDADVPKLFSELVHYFQNLAEDELIEVFNKINERQRKFYIDAVSLITTTSGIDVMKHLYSQSKINGKEMETWVASLNFIKKPSLHTISILTPLMGMDLIKKNAVLAVSSLIYRYCKKDQNCLNKPAILDAIKEIEGPLGSNCALTGTDAHNSILLSLKGVGNAGVTTSFGLLRTCYSNRDLPIELRLAAIAAHRRMSCTRNYNLDDFKDYFANPRENTEIRIASYLATMQCASYAAFAQVKDVLMNEETNQVGSFVWTHITNLQETSVQWKQGIRKLMENEFLKNKFNTDLRKYSRNYEASTFFDSLGTGASIESNVIFTSESYLPRSAMLNFTLDLFGETINVFEIGARMEGFEEIVENFFGPEGYFSDNSIKSLLENARTSHSETSDKIQQLGAEFAGDKVLQKDPAGLLYAKIFGNELSYTHFNNLQDLIGEPITAKTALDILINLFRENDIDYTKSFMFLDSSYKVPTIIGFPLEMIANGTATIGLTVKGKIDLKDLWAYKISLEGKVYPSASLQIVATMTVDTTFSKTGVQYVGSMNSNMYIDGHAIIDAGKVVDLKINVPKQQMDVIRVSSDVFMIHNEDTTKIDDISADVVDEELCTQKMFGKITGMEVCYQLKYVNASQITTAPHFPITGRFNFGVNIKKVDKFDSYQLQIKTVVEERNHKPLHSMYLYLDTPSSQVDRRIKASYHLDLEKLALKAQLISPFASFEISSSAGKEFNKYSFQLQTLFNNREIVSLQSSFKVHDAGEGLKYDSLARLNYQQKQIASVSGSLSYLHTGAYAADLKLEGITKEPIIVVGDLTCDAKSINIRTTLSSHTFNGKLQAQVQTTPESLTITSILNYSLNSNKIETLSYSSSLIKKRRGGFYEDKAVIQFESSEKPLYNLLVEFHNERRDWYFNNYGKVTFFETTWTTQQRAKFESDKTLTDFDVHTFLNCKEKEIDYKIGLLYNASHEYLNTHAFVQLNSEQRIEGLLKYVDEVSTESVYMLFYYPKQAWSFTGLMRKDSEENYYFDLVGSRGVGGDEKRFLAIVGDYSNSSIGDYQDHKVNCTLDFPESNGRWATPWLLTASLQKTSDLFLSFSQLRTLDSIYVGHMNWMKDSFSFVIQANDKRLMVVNGAQTMEAMSVLLALNVYQHFELSAKLILPVEKLDLKFFWDKDNDESRKFVFGVEKNSYKGLYNMDVEYPNQKVNAAFVLLPTQVTMNVTWGIKISQRIYLKVGNKIYNVGGIWFGELETPFQYLEKQEFQLKYYVVTGNFEVQSDISWRKHSINFLVSGSKSPSHIAGNLELNTTLAEIANVGAAMSHRHQSDDNYKTDATFVYNNHQINAQSNWKLDGLQIDSNFKVESPSNTIEPIGGNLNVDNNNTNSVLFELYWHMKSIRVQSNFQSDASKIIIQTPFERFEETILEYSVKAYEDVVSLGVTINLFKQYNNIALKWSNLHGSMEFWMDLTSPVTGYYSLHFTHSTVLGVLKESFTIRGHEFKDIVLVKLEGQILPIFETNVTVFLKLLEHKAALTILNNREPISSLITATWNDFIIQSDLSLTLIGNEINRFNWLLTSNKLDENISMNYYKEGYRYVAEIVLPNDYKIKNILIYNSPSTLVQNDFSLNTPKTKSGITYKHETSPNIFNQLLQASFDDTNFKYSLNYNNGVTVVHMNLPKNVLVNFKSSFSNLKSLMKFEVDKGDSSPIKIEGDYDFTEVTKFVNYGMQIDNSSLKMKYLMDDNSKGVVVFASSTTGDYFNTGLNARVRSDYNLETFNKTISIEGDLLGEKYKGSVSLVTKANISLKIDFDDSNKKLLVIDGELMKRGLLGRFNHQHDFLGSVKSLRMKYELESDDDGLNLRGNVVSNFKILSNSSFSSGHTYRGTDRKLWLRLEGDDHVFKINGLIRSGANSGIDFEGDFKTDMLTREVLDVQLQGMIEILSNKGTLSCGLKSNWDLLRIVEMTTGYTFENNEYSAFITYQHEWSLYRFDVTNKHYTNHFEIASKIITPHLGTITFEIKTIKKGDDYSTSVVFNENDRIYSADFATSFLSIINSATKFQLFLPDERYVGKVEIKTTGQNKVINFTITFPNNDINYFTFLWKKSPGFNHHINSSLQLDTILLPLQNVQIITNSNSLNITFNNNDEASYNLFSKFSQDELDVHIDKPDQKDYIVLTGTHKLSSLRNFSVSYMVQSDTHRMKLDVLNLFSDIYQTKFDASTNIRGWNRLTLESKLDRDKIRISLNARNHHMSLVAKKFNPKGDEILSMKFKGETLLEISAGTGQMTLLTSSRFGKYRLFIQCTQNPGIYAFTVLKSGENLVSLMVQNLSADTHMDFKAKLIAPDLIPNYSNLSLQFSADYNLANSMQFQIYNSFNKLFELRWFTKLLPGEYTGYFKFNSKLAMLQNFEAIPIIKINEDFFVDTKFSISKFGEPKEFYATILLPIKNRETKIILTHPCEANNSCEIYFNLKPKFLEFHCSSLKEVFGNVSLKTSLQYADNDLAGEFKVQHDKSVLSSKLSLSYDNEAALWGFVLRNNIMQFIFFNVENVAINGKHIFQKSIQLEVDFNDLMFDLDANLEDSRLRCVLEIDTTTQVVVEGSLGPHFDSCNVTTQSERVFTFIKSNLKESSHIDYQFAKLFSKYFIPIDILVYHDFTDSDLRQIGYKLNATRSSVFDHNIDFKGTIDFTPNFTNGTIQISLLTDERDENNTIWWFGDVTPGRVFFEIDLIRNTKNVKNHVTRMKLNNTLKSSVMDTYLIISCGERAMELIVLGDFHPNPEGITKVALELRTPLNILDEVKLYTMVQAIDNRYYLYNIINWPHDQMLQIELNTILDNYNKSVNINCISSLTDPMNSTIAYRRGDKLINFSFGSAIGADYLDLRTEVDLGVAFSGNLSSTFAGLKTCNLTALFKKEKNTLEMKLSKENLTVELNGAIASSDTDDYEMDLLLKYPNGDEDIAKAFLKMQDNNFNASLRFRNDAIRMSMGLDNNAYNIYLQSPYEYAKSVNLKGIYTNDVDVYNLKTDGHWNELVVDLGASLNLDPNNIGMKIIGAAGDYNGEMNFTYINKMQRRIMEFEAYYPSPTTNAYVKFESDGEDTMVLVKTPFDAFSSLNVKSKLDKTKQLRVGMIGNILATHFSAHNVISIENSCLNVEFDLSIPEIEQELHMLIKSSTTEGVLKIKQNSTNAFNNITMNYLVSSTQVSSNFLMRSDRYNVTHVLTVLYQNGPDIEYGVIFNNHRVIEKISRIPDGLNISVIANIPYMNIDQIGIYATRDKTNSIHVLKVFYNNYYIHSKVTSENLEKTIRGYMEINTPYLQDTTIETHLEKLDDGFTLEVTSAEVNSSLIYTNNRDIFNLALNTFNSDIKEIVIYLKKNLNTIRIHADKLLRFEIENSDVSKLDFFIDIIHNINHTLYIELSANALLFKIDTPMLTQRNVEIIVNTFTESSSKQIKAYYKQFNEKLYHSQLSLDKTKSGKYTLTGELVHRHTHIIELEAILTTDIIVSTFINLKVLQMDHKATIVLNLENPYVAKLDLISPYLQNGRYNIEFSATNLHSVTFYVSSGEMVLGNYILYQSLSRGNSINVEITAPNLKSLKLLNLTLSWDFEQHNICRNYLKINSDNFGDILIQADFKLQDDLLDIETHLRVPFLEGFETFDGTIYIPKEFRPKIELILPNTIYAFHFNHNISKHRIFISSGYHCNQTNLKFNFDLSFKNMELQTELLIPYDRFEYFNLQAKKGWYQINLNHRKYTIKHEYANTVDHKLLNFLLETPFEGYRQYWITLEYKLQSEKVLKILLTHPSLPKSEIGLLFTVFTQSNNYLKLVNHIYLPVTINNYDFIEIDLLLDMSSKKFNTILKTNNREFSLDASKSRKDLSFDTKFNENKLHFNLVGESLSELAAQLTFQTPYLEIKQLNIGFITMTNFAAPIHKNRLLLTINNSTLVNSFFSIENNKLSVIAENIWWPFSAKYKYLNDNKLDAYGKVCWDLRDVENSQIGARLHISQNVSTELILPSNKFSIDYNTTKNGTDEIYSVKTSWNEKEIIGWSSIKNVTNTSSIHVVSDMGLQLPFRTFKCIQSFDAELGKSPSMEMVGTLMWGLEPTSTLVVKNALTPGKMVSVISSPALEHDIILRVDMSQYNTVPLTLRAELEYSDNPDKLIEFEMYYNKIYSDIFSSQRNFIMRHPVSKIDYELYFSSFRRVDFSNGSIVLRYKNYDRDATEAIKASVKVDHHRFGVLGEVETSKNSFNFEAASTSGDDSLGFLVKAKVNEKDPLNLGCTYNFKKISPSINMIASYGDSRKYIFYAGLPNEREFRADLGHELYGKHYLDSLIAVKLNTSQLLWAKILWKNDLYLQFHKAVFDEYNDLRFVIEATGKEVIDVIHDDLGKEFIRDISVIKQRVARYASDERSKLLKDCVENKFTCTSNDNYLCQLLKHPKVQEYLEALLGPVIDYVKFVQIKCEQAVGGALSSIQAAMDLMAEQIEMSMKDIKNIRNIKIDAKEILKNGISDARKSLKEMEAIAVKLLDDFDNYVDYLKEQIEIFFEPFLSLLDDFVAYIEQRLAILQIAILGILDTMQHYMYNLRETKEMLQVYASYINWLEELHVTDVLEPVGDVIEEILEIIITDIKKVTEHYKPYLDALSEAIFGKYDGINQLPPVTEFRDFVNRFYQKTIWIWQYHNMTEGLKSVVHRLSNDIDDVLSFIELDDKSGDFDNPFGQTDYVFRPEIGLIEISQPLPVEWEAFNKPPAFEQHPLYQKIQRKTEQFVKFYRNRYDLIDGLENFLTDLTQPSIAPPTYNFAMVIGKSHFATFNNGFYNFVGNCSYLLASDFKTNSFSLVINYKNQTGIINRSFEIVSNGASIEIDSDFDIRFDGYAVDLPLIYSHITVTREQESVIVESTKGFKMICNVHYDFCTVQLSGWLFGKTGGLLGTLDNEKSTDIILSNGTQTDNLLEFTSSWKLQNQCVPVKNIQTVRNPAQLTPLLNRLMGNLCNVFFVNQNSPLYECFDEIDPKPFLDMCVDDMRDGHKPTICTSIAAYRARCRKANVVLEMPELCLQCPNDISLTEKIFDGHNPNTVDVVFITQLGCLEDQPNLSMELDAALNRYGFNNTHYTSVGFGGSTLPQPHVYTTKKHIWTSSDKLKIKYKYDRIRRNSEKYKAVDAVKYALNLHFRPGVSKLFILSHCDLTTDADNAPQIYNMIGEKDVTLHIIKPKPFGNSSQVVAINGAGAAVNELGAIHTANNDQLIDKIEDIYSGLALSTNGTIFDSDILPRGGMVVSWADLIAKDVRRSPCQKCKCIPDGSGVGKVECSRCLTPAVKQFLNEYEMSKKMKFSASSDIINQ